MKKSIRYLINLIINPFLTPNCGSQNYIRVVEIWYRYQISDPVIRFLIRVVDMWYRYQISTTRIWFESTASDLFNGSDWFCLFFEFFLDIINVLDTPWFCRNQWKFLKKQWFKLKRGLDDHKHNFYQAHHFENCENTTESPSGMIRAHSTK